MERATLRAKERPFLMSPSTPGPRSSARMIAFGAYEADLYARELRKGGSRRRLQEKPFAVLEILLKNAGELVTREQLRQGLWPDDTHLDFEHSLSIAVHKLRL